MKTFETAQFMKKFVLMCFALMVLFAAFAPTPASAQGLPKITVGVDQSDDPADLSVTLQKLLLLTVLSLAPSPSG